MAEAAPTDAQILARMQVPGSRNLFVLVCFERRVTRAACWRITHS